MLSTLCKLLVVPINRDHFVCPQVLMGGTIMIKDKGGKCSPIPTKSNGASCCDLYAWQPNAAGYYYSDCSMKCAPLHWLLKRLHSALPLQHPADPCTSLHAPPRAFTVKST